ncbi:hypothetical protein K458DRAFT_424530 [Lentithecium fluviatile CBS 122367]|uniref:Uncharacterized protein n=1 Tax=Lentithecium fluviatile CBS 122367 TaxID=1168545 RepID=A0A6G1IF75_9PLEO|nr:hypothetical protein K458DRAFT_424530 [Lentithecium fluviatile CBS 122367]
MIYVDANLDSAAIASPPRLGISHPSHRLDLRYTFPGACDLRSPSASSFFIALTPLRFETQILLPHHYEPHSHPRKQYFRLSSPSRLRT